MDKLQLTFNKIYQSRFKIGESLTSSIYHGINTVTDDQIALKICRKQNQNNLQHEAKAYKILYGGVGIPKLYWYGSEQSYNILVTDILGPSLAHLFRYCDFKFSLKSVLMIAEQILDRLEFLHSKHFIYRDIKPENFLVGLKEKADKIYIIDFQLISRFIDQDNNHIRLKESSHKQYGSQTFLSINGHLRLQQSRKDDLESLGYMLVYFLKGQLPWQQITHQDHQKRNLLIKEKKIQIPIQILCDGLPKQFADYLNYVKSLEFEEQPDYVWLRRLFKDLFKQIGKEYNLIFDWAEKHHLQAH